MRAAVSRPRSPPPTRDAEALPQFLHLGRQRGRVTGLALEDFHRDRAPLRRTEQPEDDLELVPLAIPIVAELRRGRPGPRGCHLDLLRRPHLPVVAGQQPVHRGIQLVGIRLRDVEHLPQAGGTKGSPRSTWRRRATFSGGHMAHV